jgi:hypothetical protein
LQDLDEGEKAALILAASLGADLLLLDDREGVRVAREKGFRVIGTLRVLHLAATRGVLDLAECFEQLKRTNFRYRPGDNGSPARPAIGRLPSKCRTLGRVSRIFIEQPHDASYHG